MGENLWSTPSSLCNEEGKHSAIEHCTFSQEAEIKGPNGACIKFSPNLQGSPTLAGIKLIFESPICLVEPYISAKSGNFLSWCASMQTFHLTWLPFTARNLETWFNNLSLALYYPEHQYYSNLI